MSPSKYPAKNYEHRLLSADRYYPGEPSENRRKARPTECCKSHPLTADLSLSHPAAKLHTHWLLSATNYKTRALRLAENHKDSLLTAVNYKHRRHSEYLPQLLTHCAANHKHRLPSAANHKHRLPSAANHKHRLPSAANHTHRLPSAANHTHRLLSAANHTHRLLSAANHTHTGC